MTDSLEQSNIPSQTIRDWDNNHYLHPWNPVKERQVDRTIAAQGDGIYLIDPDGRRYIDGPGGMWCVQIGYGRPEMATAIAEQVQASPYCSPWYFASAPSSILARWLAEHAPGDLNNVFFTTGGSTAVDSALRFVHFYHNVRGHPEKKIVISRERSYHGSTYLAASVTGKERDRSFMDVERDAIRFLPDVNPELRPEGMDESEWCDRKVQDLEDAILETGPDRVGGFIAEPVLASGGVIIPPAGYHQRTLEVCRKHDVLYISDEVVTGFGRLGHWFASESEFGIVPDIITCAKGLTSGYLPLGAAIVSDRLLEAIAEREADAIFGAGYTYSGHLVSCAAALKNIEILEQERILEHVQAVRPHFLERLTALRRHEIVRSTRGIGLLGAVEGVTRPEVAEADRLESDWEFGKRVDQICQANGLIVRPLVNMVVLSPPLIITESEIDQMFDILDDALATVQRETQQTKT